MKKKAAVIDMGTNTFHLILVEFCGDSFETIYKEKIPVKIGEGGISHRTILPDAQKRAFHTLGHFHNLIQGEQIQQISAFATSAVRNATNGLEFIKAVQQRFGFPVQVIDGDREAELIYKGIKLSGSLNEECSLMVDIGGGSVEFIIGNEREIFWKQSFEIGGQRMLDLFHYHDPILPDEVDKLNEYLGVKLSQLLSAIIRYKPSRFVGASGTFDTLTDIYLASDNETRHKKHYVYSIPVSDFHTIARQLLTLNKTERLEIKGMIPMRVDMIVVASCLISFILRHITPTRLYCSTYSLKEGAIAELMQKSISKDSPILAQQLS
ncbi:Ppx/GppA phosphatase family protein [Lunatibacter salilacus]|uniref:Ppx/GppA phosphatase family protein n=1 Tax=Lunatibacter salilacus TaxID=2483804 RepID=UPI00131DCE7E|nr:exopolyphosphatase [Lunatibacter salilacus]